MIISPFFNSTTTQFEIWVTSDLWESVSGQIDAAWYYYNGTKLPTPAFNTTPVTIGALNSTRVYSANLDQLIGANNFQNVVMRMNVSVKGHLPNSNTTQTFTHTNWFHASPLSQARLVDPGLTLSHDNASQSFVVKATSGVSAWTWLDYPDGVVVAFEDNGFWLGKGESKTLTYNVTGDTTSGSWIEGVTVQSLWNNTQS